MGLAFEITPEDIENVLSENALKVANSHGKTFEQMADDLHGQLNLDAAEKAALKADCDLEAQTAAAYDNLRDQLVVLGILKG